MKLHRVIEEAKVEIRSLKAAHAKSEQNRKDMEQAERTKADQEVF